MKFYTYLEETYIKVLRTILIVLVFFSLCAAIIIFLMGIYQFTGMGISKPKSITVDSSLKPTLIIKNDIENVFKNLPMTNAEELEAKRKNDEERAELERRRQELDKEKQLFDSKKQSEFRMQAEKLALASRAFLELRKRDELISLEDLSKTIYEKIRDYNISVLCSPFYSNKETEVICNSPLYPSSQKKSGKVLKFDAIDITQNSEAFFSKKINYFEMQSKALEQVLENEKMKTLFMEEKINDPIFEALTLNHNNIQNSIFDFYKKGQEIIKAEGVQENMSEYRSAKAIAQLTGTKTLTISLAVFGSFVALMLLIVFYKIERHLNSYAKSNRD